jgi:hypothetical protein
LFTPGKLALSGSAANFESKRQPQCSIEAAGTYTEANS